MTNQQGAPEALRLADKLNSLCVAEFAWPTLNEAAIRLRRLHAENERLSAQVEAFSAAQAELAAMRAGGEPVAWAATSEDGDVEALGMNQSRRFDTPLYTHPQPAAQDAEPCPDCTPWPKGTQPALHPTTGEPMGTDAQEATAWKLTAENLQRENVGLWKALKDAATSLETISRLAGRTNYVGEDGDQVETYMKHHHQVRRYANSRASVAREALAGTAPAPMPSPTPQADSTPAAAPWRDHLADQADVIDCVALQRAMVLHGISFPDGGMEHFRASLGDMVNRFVRFAAPQADSVMEDAARDVLSERARQISAEGWTPEHDDEHECGDMARATACYLLVAAGYPSDDVAILRFWPWLDAWWKPTDQRLDLVKAGALILAEIERIDRAARKQGGA